MLLLLLDGILETPTDPGSDGAEKDETVTEIEGGSTKDELLGPQQVVTSASPQVQMQHLIPLCSSISTEESSHTKKTDASANLSICRTEGVPCHSAATTKHQEEYQGVDSASPHALSPIDVSATRQSRGAKGGQLSVRAQVDGAPDCDLSSLGEKVGSKARTDGELQTNGKIVADLPGSQLYREQWSSPLTCSPEDLANRRRMVKQLILEAADRRIFLEDLKMWRQQYNQRAKLREVLNPYILKIQTLQQGYLKRCPCLYHQQQDQQEEEERQANLKLLDSLESSIWGAGDQSPTQTRSFSFQGAFSSEELQEFGSEEFGTLNHGDSASSGGLSLASAFRQTANTPVGRTFSKERYPSNRQQSLVSSSECCSLEREISRSSTGSENRRSSSSPVVKPPSHCSSLGSAPLLGSCEGQTPSSSPTRLRSPAVSRAERHQRGGSREESVSRGDLEVSVEERKKRMQQQAMEKAQRVKEDARVAFLVVFMKQLQPGTPALGIEMADRINLSHLNSKTLPKGKGWKTQGLLRMIDGIVTLVCKLPRGAGVASVLQPLLALASQTRAEDIDLAIHAELEGIRRALLRLPVGGSTDDEMGQTGDGQAVGLQRDGKRKSKDSSIGYAIAGTEEEDTKTISTDAAGPVRKATQEASLQDTRKSRPKPEKDKEGRASSRESMAQQKVPPIQSNSRDASERH
ncbi:WD domain, G-beta repeat-containing protein, putative [Eimeria mitis]|uniref:WD domain, G-beta repeat-containing protein, putative n=1 Tax=Eimeria mitis TaxID=44415 RepID=U6KFR5_9EIME|nr:WD domain, G-beta repeat-containing protein, putative [Eimeria mitis]CDJ36794.1 WD domain, G-beta repeat-containing protein, putative [Eimeria mitis]